MLTLNGTSISGADVHASVDVPKLGALSAAAVATKLKDETLKLVKIDVLLRDIVDAANDSPEVLDALKDVGRDGRIAHQVIMERCGRAPPQAAVRRGPVKMRRRMLPSVPPRTWRRE